LAGWPLNMFVQTRFVIPCIIYHTPHLDYSVESHRPRFGYYNGRIFPAEKGHLLSESHQSSEEKGDIH
jgi:hypothetical protein